MSLVLDPSKDQHLLISKEAISLLIESSNIKDSDKILEIGSGSGLITEEIAKITSNLTSFETDPKFLEDLEKIQKKYKITLVQNNALKYPWHSFNKLISNPPFSLLEAIIQKSIKENIQSLTIITSSGFKESLSSESKIALITSKFYSIDIIKELPPSNFEPEPKTSCFILQLKRKVPKTQSEKLIQSFLLKNNKIKNALIYTLVEFGKTKNQARELIIPLKLTDQVANKPVQKITPKLLNLIEKNLSDKL